MGSSQNLGAVRNWAIFLDGEKALPEPIRLEIRQGITDSRKSSCSRSGKHKRIVTCSLSACIRVYVSGTSASEGPIEPFHSYEHSRHWVSGVPTRPSRRAPAIARNCR
jgi:hypothetical protein